MVKSEVFLLFNIAFLVFIIFLHFCFKCLYFDAVISLFLAFFVLIRFFDFSVKLYLIIFLAFFVALFRYLGFENLEEEHVAFLDSSMEFSACVVSEVDVRKDKVKYILELSDFDGLVLWNFDKYPRFEFGDCFLFEANFKEIDEIDGFDYGAYLRRYGVYKILDVYDYERDFSSKMSFYDFIKYRLFSMKIVFENRLNNLFLEPYSSFMAGLLLGSRRGISDKLMEDFNTTGLTHIIAISGYNITLLIVVISSVFSFFSKRVRIFLSIFLIFLFVVFVGASSAVLRAGIMGVISLMALFFERQYYVFISLIFSAFLMTFVNPYVLLVDVGFQLSFLATLGLIIISDKISFLFKFLPEKFLIRESVLMTISAQIFALPIILSNYGRLSLISPIANLLVLPFLPFSMLFGFLGVFFGKIFAFFAFLSLKILIFIVSFLANIKFASIDVNISHYFYYIYCFFIMQLFFRVNRDDLL